MSGKEGTLFSGTLPLFPLKLTERMFIVIGFMAGGMCIGFMLRNRHLPGLNKAITVLIWILLFLLGIEVGENRRIIQGLATLGIEAFALSLASAAGSCIAAKGLWMWLNKKRNGS